MVYPGILSGILFLACANDGNDEPSQADVDGLQITFEPVALLFQATQLGCVREKTVTVTNNSDQPISLSSISTSSPAFSTQLWAGERTLMPGEPREVTVNFAPTTLLDIEDTLTFTTRSGEEAYVPIIADTREEGICLELSAEITGALDVHLLIETTPQTEAFIRSPDTLLDLPSALADHYQDLTLGVANFSDYRVEGLGDPRAVPYTMITQQTNAVPRVEWALQDALWDQIADGDVLVSGYEALYQLASGRGYDLNCDQHYDPETDILPFKRQPEDVFSGLIQGTFSGAVEGTGGEGGIGAREGTVHAAVVFSASPFREPAIDGGPGGCAQDAGFDEAATALEAEGVRVFTVGINEDFEDTDVSALSEATRVWRPDVDLNTLVTEMLNAALAEDVVFTNIRFESSDPDRIDLYSEPWGAAPGWGDVFQLPLSVNGEFTEEGGERVFITIYGTWNDLEQVIFSHTFRVLP